MTLIRVNYLEVVIKVLKVFPKGTNRPSFTIIGEYYMPTYRRKQRSRYPYNYRVYIFIPSNKSNLPISEGDIVGIIGHIESYKNKLVIRVRQYMVMKKEIKETKEAK